MEGTNLLIMAPTTKGKTKISKTLDHNLTIWEETSKEKQNMEHIGG